MPKNVILANAVHLFASVLEINPQMWSDVRSSCNRKEEDIFDQLHTAVDRLLFKKNKYSCKLETFEKFLWNEKLFPVNNITNFVQILLFNLPIAFKVC